jgi:hypothetical protein
MVEQLFERGPVGPHLPEAADMQQHACGGEGDDDDDDDDAMHIYMCSARSARSEGPTVFRRG